jgi:twitching motility protein PilI
MARREALREMQGRLAERLVAARAQPAALGWLAVEAGGHGFLLPLTEAGEIFPVSALLPVPHTHPWFLGVANLRGGLHGVVELAGFFGLRSAAGGAARDGARLVALNPQLDVNAALLVDRLAGLRSPQQLTRDAAQEESGAGPQRPAFVGERYRDEGARSWQELRLSGLVRDERFLRVVA